MKRFLLCFLCFIGLASCQKEDNAQTTRYDIDYQYGKSYTQTFYVGQHYIVGGPTIGVGYSIISACNRLYFDIKEGEEGFSELRPPQEFYNDVVRRNNNQRHTELKYYAIADFHFTYNGSPTDITRETEWKLVIGKMEEYVFNGSIYTHLVVVEEL